MADKAELVITALQQRIGELVANYETQIAILRAEITQLMDKDKERESYAQNIYAALCNQSWQRNDVWPLLKDETYSCSWRYAGGIVADMREEGDYIDWYCSGIGGPTGGGSEYDPELEKAMLATKDFVPEGTVTDEIREDFFKLGWIPVNETDDNI